MMTYARFGLTGRRRAGLAVASSVMMLAASWGNAQAESASSWREPFAGGRLSWLEVEDVDDGDLNIGIFVGGRVLRHVAISGGLDYHTADFDLESRETYALTASLEVYPMKRKVTLQPYLLAGVGFYTSRFEFVDCCGNVIIDDTEYEFGGHAGAGLDIVLGDMDSSRLSLNTELRRIFTDEESGNDQVEPDGTMLSLSLKLSGAD